MKKYLVTKIFWDVDCPEDLEDLPQNVEVECEGEDEIADILSDDYGFCVDSFNAELDV